VTITNWAGNIAFAPATLTRPGSAEELRATVAASSALRVLGAGHSFNTIADSHGTLVTLDGLPHEIEIDSARSTVRVSGGVRYAELASHLDKHGFALANLASLPHITVAGATATGTHGSGDRNGSLATAITGVELLTADGDQVTVPDEQVSAAAVSLGALGITTALTLRIVPAFTARQWVYDNLPRAELTASFGQIYSSAYSVSAFTTWQDPGVIDMLWLKHRADDGWPPGPATGTPGGTSPDRTAPDGTPGGTSPGGTAPETWHGARLADGPRHPVPGQPTEATTQQQGAEGPWHERLPHFRAEFVPSAGEELQSEYLLPREYAADAIEALVPLAPRIAPLLMINEIRTVAADDLWLSPCYGRPTVAMHFTWRKDTDAVGRVLPAIEDAFAPFGTRPHWGKVFTMSPEGVRAAYPRLEDFARLARSYDPAGKFRNDFLSPYLEA
jgi:xylitol oxidase